METLKKYAWIILCFVTLVAVVASVTFFSINVNQGRTILGLKEQISNHKKDVEAYEATLNSLPNDVFIGQLGLVFSAGYEGEIDDFTAAIMEYFSKELAGWIERNNIRLYYENNTESYDPLAGRGGDA